jgi:hypothetical protein
MEQNVARSYGGQRFYNHHGQFLELSASKEFGTFHMKERQRV